MDAQMSSYPPPPQPDQQHYNPIYPTSAGAQQLLDPVQQDNLNFSQLGQALSQPSPYPKVETEPLDPATSSQLEQRIEQLRQQQPFPSHPPQQEVLQEQQQHPDLNGQSQGDAASKVNRLRKACDSCSIRKVKVGSVHRRKRRRYMQQAAQGLTPSLLVRRIWTSVQSVLCSRYTVYL